MKKPTTKQEPGMVAFQEFCLWAGKANWQALWQTVPEQGKAEWRDIEAKALRPRS